MRRLLLRSVALLLALTAATTGCSYDGITSVPLPFREGTGEDSYQITVRMGRAAGLTQNGEVKLDDVTVGTIESMSIDGWTAELVVGLNADVRLPQGTRARMGQKSLLGAKYLELITPDRADPQSYLADGDEIGLDLTGAYPETEEVLSALAVVLNGSGLQQVRTITEELNDVFSGREPQVKRFLHRFTAFVGALDRQRETIISVLDRLSDTTRTLRRNDVLEQALETLPDALATLDADRGSLVRTLRAVSRLGRTAETVIDESGHDFTTVLADLQPTLTKLADTGTDLVDSLSVLVSFPFPSNTSFPSMFRGDYGNLFLTLDVSPKLLLESLRLGFAEGPGSSMLNAPPLGSGDKPSSPLDPFLDDLDDLGDLDDGLGDLSGARGDSDTPGLLGQLLTPRSTGETTQPNDGGTRADN